MSSISNPTLSTLLLGHKLRQNQNTKNGITYFPTFRRHKIARCAVDMPYGGSANIYLLTVAQSWSCFEVNMIVNYLKYSEHGKYQPSISRILENDVLNLC
ncbi:hypothetical protein QQP08_010049 [Theobroma cacao]|nr:hypothetical protein QQP08_010049 [Theobroma cacao]